jgi:proline iminopeptidase
LTSPPPDSFNTGSLEVGDGHNLVYDEVGSPGGVPVVYLHGGPGSGVTAGVRRSFDPGLHRAVLVDQRGAGRSTPHASGPLDWETISMDHHVADLERLREHLGIDRWIVFGISWGTVLGAVYATRHPDRVSAAVLAAVGLGRRIEVDWLTVFAGRVFPEAWDELTRHVPQHLRDERVVDAYRSLVFDSDPAVADAAALAWRRWEDAHVVTTQHLKPNPRYEDPALRLAFARQVTHCWSNDHWLEDDDIIRRADRLAGIPCTLIHGRLDVSGPLESAWRLHHAWAGSELIVVEDEGHTGPAMFRHWSDALARHARHLRGHPGNA